MRRARVHPYYNYRGRGHRAENPYDPRVGDDGEREKKGINKNVQVRK